MSTSKGRILKPSQQGAAVVGRDTQTESAGGGTGPGAESVVYARLFVGGGEALAWRRRAKAAHVEHRGVGRDTQTESAGGGTGPGAESAVYARLVVVGGGEALAWRRRAKASHVVHRGVGRAASEHGTPEHRRLSRRQRSRCHPLADSQRHHVSLRTADIVSAARANLRSSHLCSGRGGPCRMVLGGP